MSPNKKQIISASIITIFLAFAIYYLTKNWHNISQITQLTFLQIISLIVIFIGGYITVAIITLYLLKPLNIKIGIIESFQISIVTGFYNLITPFRGGMAARAYYLKRKYSFAYSDFVATLTASYILIFFVSAVAGLLSISFMPEINSNAKIIFYILFISIIISLGTIMIFSPKFKETKSNFLNKIIRVVNGWHIIKNNKKIILTTLIFSALQIILSAIMIQLQFSALSIKLPFYATLLLASVSSLSLLVAITPAGFGINEGLIILTASTFGISPAQSLAAALLGRAISLIVLFILGPIYSYQLMRKTKK